MFWDRCILKYIVKSILLSNTLPRYLTIFFGFRKVSPSMANTNASDETIELRSETNNVEVGQGSDKSSIQSTCPKA